MAHADVDVTNSLLDVGPQDDLAARVKLQATVLEITDQEKRQLGEDLHDGLGQHLTGIAFMSKVLQRRLAERGLPEAAEAQKILTLVNEAINTTRELARGLFPIVSDRGGLTAALEQIASDVEDLYGITCRFEGDRPIHLPDLVATQLCRITREAVNNAIRHGGASEIVITLVVGDRQGTLTIRDNGNGFTSPSSHDPGMGLHIMRYRAGGIGGTLHVEGGAGKTTVACGFPIDALE